VTAQLPKTFGPYQAIALLGVGGMGEVYRGRDPRLKRDVAIKVLARTGADPVRQRRFTEEAQAASALNHPNILSVYDVGSDEGTPFIVSELVEGTSLRDLLVRAPLAVRQALELGAEMADGLAAAHQAGIVHRDVKPDNVMVTRDGHVKILDFGLALIGMRDGISSAQTDATLTATGIIVGTVPYMSPEQARGAAVDYRTDQFSLGLTLYEMLTGRRAFAGETVAQTLAAILDDEPEPMAKLNPRIPAPLRWAVERCLAKDARQRYDATGDLARELRTLRDRLPEFTTPSATDAPPSRRRTALLVAASLSIVAAAFGATVALSDSGDRGIDGYRFTPVATDAGYQGEPAWSPDGKTLAYIAEQDSVLQVFTRPLGSSMRAQVTHSRFDCHDPFWSPDGTRIYYTALARDRNGLWSITPAGGDPELVIENINRAAMSPDGKTLAFFRGFGDDNALFGFTTLWFASPPSAEPVRYTRPPFGSRPGYSDQTAIHFSPDGSKLGVWVVPWWEEARERWEPEFWVIPMSDAAPHKVAPVASDLPTIAAPFSWLPDSRHIVSALGHPVPGVHLWLTDTEGSASRLLTVTGGAENDPAISPDGSRVAVSLQQSDYDLYKLSIEHPAPAVLLTTSRSEMDPAWSPLGDQVAFTTDRSGHEEIWLRSQNGDWERPLVTPQDFGEHKTTLLSAAAFSPDGQRIAYYRLGPEGQRIWITPVAGGPPVQLAPGAYAQDSPTWSPDGTWIAYVQGRRGEWSLAKTRLGARSAPDAVARDILPYSPVRWSPNDAWIAYNGRNGLSLVSPDGRSTRVVQDSPWLAFTWSADGRRLFGIRQSDDLRHLTFSSVDIESKSERVLAADFMPIPPSGLPVRGFTRVSATAFITALAQVRSDVWLLDGIRPPRTLWDRLSALTSVGRR
jgi:serine/threonine protein kinase